MTRQYELVERVLSYQPSADEAMLNRAYVYAMRAHGNQKRASGAPYFSHPLEVAAILAEMRLDDATIATALLHDTIEDTDVTRSEIDTMFGAEIGTLVDGLTKIKKLDLVTKKAEQAENFRKLLLAISSDIRVLLVKLADRLHNMRTLEHMKPAKRKIIAEETMDIYAPLAGRMGMQWLREELEDHAFRWLNPEAYDAVVERLKILRTRNQGLIDEIEGALTTKLEEAKVRGIVAGREKKPYAIWNKMERKQISLRAAFRHLRIPHRRPRRARLLSCPGRDPHHVARGAGPLQGLHLQSEAERLPVDPHDDCRTQASACRTANPHRGDALDRRIRRRRPCALQGREWRQRQGGPLAGFECLSLAASSRGNAARWRQPRGIPRTYQARAVPGSGVLLYPEGPLDRVAEGRELHRLRLCGSHRCRQYLRRRQDQRPADAARFRTQEW